MIHDKRIIVKFLQDYRKVKPKEKFDFIKSVVFLERFLKYADNERFFFEMYGKEDSDLPIVKI